MTTLDEIDQLHETIKKICGADKIEFEDPITSGPKRFSITALAFWPIAVEAQPELAGHTAYFRHDQWHIFPRASFTNQYGRPMILFECCFIAHPSVLNMAFDLELQKQQYLAEHRAEIDCLAKFCDELVNNVYKNFPEDVAKAKNNRIFDLMDRIVESSITKKALSSIDDTGDFQKVVEIGFDFPRIASVTDEYKLKFILADNLYRPSEFWLKNQVKKEVVKEIYDAGECCDLYLNCSTVSNAKTVVEKTFSLVDKLPTQTTRQQSCGGMYV